MDEDISSSRPYVGGIFFFSFNIFILNFINFINLSLANNMSMHVNELPYS